MSSTAADNQYEAQNDDLAADVPAGNAGDNDYKSRPGQSEIPVQSDNATVEDPIDPATADSDATLAADDQDVDQSNIINERTRGAAKPQGSYAEPSDEANMPTE